jgi:hypothetical protein
MATPETAGAYGVARQFANMDILCKRVIASGANVLAQPEFLTGNVFYVDSGVAASGDGSSPALAVSTLDAAVALCTANNGDKIIVLPGHAETLIAADQIDLDVAGIRVIGLGVGATRPTFTYTVAAGEITVGADNVTIENIRCVSSVTAVLKAINVEAGVDYTTIRGCEFTVEATGTDEFNATIYFEDNNTGFLVEGNTIHMGLGGAVAAIHMDADTSYGQIIGNYITGDYSTACIVGDTTLSTNILIKGNLLVQGVGGNIGTEPAIELLTNTTGIIADNYIVCNVAAPANSIVADQCFLFENYYTETVSTGDAASGVLIGLDTP